MPRVIDQKSPIREKDVTEYLDRNQHILIKLIRRYFERHYLFGVLGYFLESLCAGQYYAPLIVEAAESFERAGELKEALRLYKDGAQRCHYQRIMIYDENTGGQVSAKDYPGYEDVINEAHQLVKKCQAKVAELKFKLS